MYLSFMHPLEKMDLSAEGGLNISINNEEQLKS